MSSRGAFALASAALIAAGAVALAEDDATRDADWVAARVKEWQPTAAERRFDEIGWAKDLPAAEKLGKANGRPVFLFTHNGRMETGRC